MKKISAALLVLFLFSSAVVFAGPGSDHSHEPSAPISEEKALKTAGDVVVTNVKKGKLDQSWENVKPTKIIQKTFKKEPEWVIIFNNDKIVDQNKQTLYVFLSLSGHYLGANYTGN